MIKLYGLIGRPLKHSFSKAFFTKKFQEEGMDDCRYENFELDSIKDFQNLFISHPNLKGLNVTIPYKKEVIPFLYSANEIVQQIGACNCIKRVDGKLYGFNTDVIGFQQSLQKHLKPHHTNALILGTGGSSVAVQYALKNLDIAFQLVSRTPQQNGITYDDVDASVVQSHPIIINTTPIGMFPHIDAAPAIPYQFVTQHHLLFDLIYNPEKTLFLQKGEERGAGICNGYEMLILQAEESWRIWNKA